MARILRGKPVAEAILERTAAKVHELNDREIYPTLAIFRVGQKGADISYEKGAGKRCEETGVKVKHFTFAEDVEPEEFYRVLDEANKDPSIHGILVFRPLPKDRFRDEELRNRIAPEKDVDGCTDLSLAGIFTNKDLGFAPCTAQAVIEILNHYGIGIRGKNVVVLGRSLVIGKPVSMMLLNRNATVTICHTRTADPAGICSKAEILVCTTGQMEMVTREYTNEKQTVIDVGIDWNEKKQKLCGDVLYDDVEPFVEDLTPVPGGVGSVTTSVLVSHVAEAAERMNRTHK